MSLTKKSTVESHGDARGVFTVIENVATFGGPIGAVAVMTRKAGTVAAEHRHAREGHTCHLVSGRMFYYQRTPSESGIEMTPVTAGESVYTPPDVDHAFEFLEDSIVVVVANISRTQEEYERDITRLTGNDRLVQQPQQTLPLEGAPRATATMDVYIAPKERKERVLQFFAHTHLKPDLQPLVKAYAGLAETIVQTCPANPERTLALRKLVTSKDEACRAKLAKDD